jgi:hypothetical protein
MLKLTSSALGLLAIVVIAPSSSAALQNQPSLQKIDRELHVQQLKPIRKPVMLRTIVGEKTTPTSEIEVPRLNEVERQKEIDLRPNRNPNINAAPRYRDVRDLPSVAF